MAKEIDILDAVKVISKQLADKAPLIPVPSRVLVQLAARLVLKDDKIDNVIRKIVDRMSGMTQEMCNMAPALAQRLIEDDSKKAIRKPAPEDTESVGTDV